MVFIAVNSGNSAAAVRAYAEKTKFEWPILVDAFRTTEARYGQKISLNNIYWWYVVAPDGTVEGVGSDWDRAARRIERLLPRAKMTFDGIDVPPMLFDAARDFEWGHYEKGAGTIARFAKRSSGKDGVAARKMRDRVMAAGDAILQKARKLESDGDPYGALQLYERLLSSFGRAGYDRVSKMAISRLRKDFKVKRELAALALLGRARDALRRDPASAPRVRPLLELIEKKYGETRAARNAKTLGKSLAAAKKR